jgi:hypothetical protein
VRFFFYRRFVNVVLGPSGKRQSNKQGVSFLYHKTEESFDADCISPTSPSLPTIGLKWYFFDQRTEAALMTQSGPPRPAFKGSPSISLAHLHMSMYTLIHSEFTACDNTLMPL